MSSRAPTISRRLSNGSCVRAGPNAATATANATVAVTQPYSEEDQLRVLPTARTIVSASTASTCTRGTPRQRGQAPVPTRTQYRERREDGETSPGPPCGLPPGQTTEAATLVLCAPEAR